MLATAALSGSYVIDVMARVARSIFVGNVCFEPIRLVVVVRCKTCNFRVSPGMFHRVLAET